MTQTGIIDLSYADLLAVFGLLLLAAGLARWQQVGQEKALLVAALRMVAQLLLVGLLLRLLFSLDSAAAVLLVAAVMALFAIREVEARVSHRFPRFRRIVGLSLFVGCGAATAFFCELVIGLDPWFDPRYLIPLAGMIIGNSMTGASLAAERLAAEIREQRLAIETALCLGAPASLAARDMRRSAFRAALIPSINAMAAMGIVFLPGMMTGQILSGTEPLVAVRYQIAIMCVITGSVALVSLLLVWLGSRACFTPDHQLREEEI